VKWKSEQSGVCARECFGRGVGRAKHGAVREKCVLSTPVTSPLKPPLLWGRLRPKERRFDRSYVFQWLLWDYVLGAFLPSLLGWCRNADLLINIGPDTRYKRFILQKVGTDDAPGTRRRLGTTPIVDGRTQWVSLSAAIENPSNREPMAGPRSIVLVAP
jgi:hypothetical protein